MTKSNMFHMREALKAMAESFKMIPDGQTSLSEKDITNLTGVAFELNKGMAETLSNQPELQWIFNNSNYRNFVQNINDLFQGIKLNLSGEKEEAFQKLKTHLN